METGPLRLFATAVGAWSCGRTAAVAGAGVGVWANISGVTATTERATIVAKNAGWTTARFMWKDRMVSVVTEEHAFDSTSRHNVRIGADVSMLKR